MDSLLAGDPLIVYLEAFQRTGFTDLDFVLTEDSDAWQMMLDVVGDDLAAFGLALKPGHRMMIMSRLRKAKIEMERAPDESRQRRASPSPTTLRKTDSSKHDDADPPQMSACTTFVDGFRPLWNVPVVWRLTLALVVLALSLLLWALYQAAAGQVGADVAGGWLFVKVLYIIGFTVSSICAMLGVIDAVRLRQSGAGSDPIRLSLPTTLDCPTATCCGGAFQGVPCPACQPLDCSKLYKILCCRCSIQID